jgi:hypothetical protein
MLSPRKRIVLENTDRRLGSLDSPTCLISERSITSSQKAFANQIMSRIITFCYLTNYSFRSNFCNNLPSAASFSKMSSPIILYNVRIMMLMSISQNSWLLIRGPRSISGADRFLSEVVVLAHRIIIIIIIIIVININPAGSQPQLVGEVKANLFLHL